MSVDKSADRIPVTVRICPHCGHVDDLVPHPGTGASRRCPCPHSEVAFHERQLSSDVRHRAAVALARSRWTARLDKEAS